MAFNRIQSRRPFPSHVPNVSLSFSVLSHMKSSSDRLSWAAYPCQLQQGAPWDDCAVTYVVLSLCQACKSWLLLSWAWASPWHTLLTQAHWSLTRGYLRRHSSRDSQPAAEAQARHFHEDALSFCSSSVATNQTSRKLRSCCSWKLGASFLCSEETANRNAFRSGVEPSLALPKQLALKMEYSYIQDKNKFDRFMLRKCGNFSSVNKEDLKYNQCYSVEECAIF